MTYSKGVRYSLVFLQKTKFTKITYNMFIIRCLYNMHLSCDLNVLVKIRFFIIFLTIVWKINRSSTQTLIHFWLRYVADIGKVCIERFWFFVDSQTYRIVLENFKQMVNKHSPRISFRSVYLA